MDLFEWIFVRGEEFLGCNAFESMTFEGEMFRVKLKITDAMTIIADGTLKFTGNH
jgi:hypothetical protein